MRARSWRRRAPKGGWPKDEATAYALAVRDGEEIAGPHVRNACARHLEDLAKGRKRGLKWSVPHVEWILSFFRQVLKLNGGDYEGLPFQPLPFQAFILGSLFGWLDAKTGMRRFRVAFIEIAKGNGKSPLAAGTGIYMLVADGEPRAECYSAATKKDQAMILFRDAVAMVELSPTLKKRLKPSGKNPVWNLAHLDSGSFFRPVSSDDAQSGPRPHCALLDEIHEHKSATVVEMMRAGTKNRRQALIFMITNSGVDRTSVCFDRHEYGRKVCSGELEDDTYFAYISAVDEGDDPIQDEADPELGYPRSWAKANPSIGRFLPVSYLEEQVREARGMPSKESTVRRLNFCQWVDATSPWISGDAWRSCEVEELAAGVAGRPCFLGLDLSGKRDLTALAMVWPDGEGGFDARVEFWTPGDTLLHRASVDRVPYDLWEREKYLHAPEGKSIDFGVIARRVLVLNSILNVAGLAFDPWRFEDFSRELENEGVDWWEFEGPDQKPGDGLMLVRHGQGFAGGGSDSTLWMPRSITELEDAILHARIRVERNPVLTWNAASAVVLQDAQENRKWEKRKSTGRIDGIVALCQAVGLASAGFVKDGPSSVYETRGVRSIG